MRPPEFDELVEGADDTERRRLRRAHDLLLAAGPPPELPAASLRAPRVRRGGGLEALRGRRLVQALAAAAIAAFGIGFVVATSIARQDDFGAIRSLEMAATPAAPGAVSLLEVGEPAEGGNIPLELTVSGLEPLPEGGYYELWLTRETGGRQERVVSCGTFVAGPERIVVRLNAPYRLRRSPGWIVTRHAPGEAAEPVVLTT